MSTIVSSLLALGGMAAVFGAGLSYAGIKFLVEEDPRLQKLTDALPGANCGGCGVPGCEAFAEALLKNEAKAEDCAVCNEEAAIKIGEILGVEVVIYERRAAFVKCGGDFTTSNYRYVYHGLGDCNAAAQLADGGAKACAFGCLGGGSCVSVCKFDAIELKNGTAFVDSEKCTACGCCVNVCPKNVIEFVPQKNMIRVACISSDAAKETRAKCSVGCIACKLCEKDCGRNAIKIENQFAAIDYEKCDRCGDCAKKCPVKCILAGE